jgi:predicted O-methyltransferase YrrM
VVERTQAVDPRWAAVDDYIADRLLGRDEALGATLAANAQAGLPDIDVSAAQGRMLHLLARMAGARRILEVGTLGGYSTIELARVLPEDGRLVTLELEPRHAAVARENIARAGLVDKVEVIVGPAAASLAAMSNEPPFDFVFIDADKPSNPIYLREALRLVRPGATIVVDNVVREGGVLDADSADDRIRGTPRAVRCHRRRAAAGRDGGADGGCEEVGRLRAGGFHRVSFTYHRAVAPLIRVFVCMASVELVVVHLLVAMWRPDVALVLSLLSLASIGWLVRVIRSFRRLPVLIEHDRLVMRVGTLKRVDVSRAQVAGLRQSWDAATLKERGTVKLSLIAYPNVVVDLDPPVPDRRGLVRAVAHRLDDLAAFTVALDRWRSAADGRGGEREVEPIVAR